MTEADLLERAKQKIGTVVRDKYTIDGVLGVGGMAVVYKATHRNQAEFALKMLHPELSIHSDVRARFLREGYAANSVKHPGAVLVVDDDVAEDGAAFLVMELLKGRTAEQLANDWGGKLPLDMTLAVADQLLDVMAAAHEKGIVHRDIKPANLFVTQDGTLKVLDFRIARVRDALGGAGNALSTAVGTYVGTPAFMAPEQAGHKAAEIDAQTDVWATGATMFTLLTGTLVHDGEAVSQVLVKAATSSAPPLRSLVPTVPPPIAEVVDKALAFEKKDRWPSVTAMREALVAAVHASALPSPSRTALAMMPVRSMPPSSPVVDAIASAPTLAAPPATTRSLSGKRVRPRRRLGLWVAIGGAAIGAGVVTIAAMRHPAAPAAPRPRPAPSASSMTTVSGTATITPVLVLAITNGTADPMLDGTTDAILSTALRRSTKLDPFSGSKLHEIASEVDPQHPNVDEGFGARLAAARSGSVITVQGTVSPGAGGYTLSLQVKDAASGSTMIDRSVTADAAHYVATVCGVADDIRRLARDPAGPGDATTPENLGLSASLDAVHEWNVGQALNSLGKYTEAETRLQRAVQLDPEFSQARSALALCLWNEAKRSEAEQQFRIAFKWVDRMGERDRLGFLGDYYGTVGDYPRAIDAYEKLRARWPQDLSSAINLAVTYQQFGDDKRALEAGRSAAQAFPRNPLARGNMVSFLLRTDAFDEALREGQRVMADLPTAPEVVPGYMAIAQLLLGRPKEAVDVLSGLTQKDPRLAAAGLADVALYEGRLHDATAILEAETKATRAEHDEVNENGAWMALAGARLRLGDTAGALAAAAQAARSDEARLQALAASVFIEAHHPERAAAITTRLSGSLSPDDRAMGQRLAGEALRARGKAREAVTALQESLSTRDAWLTHFALGRAYMDLGAMQEAYTELQTCVQHRGDAADYWMPSAHLVPPAVYWLARAEEAIGNPEAANTYAQYLAMVAPAQDDPLAADAARRAHK
ncbi:MAG TPA: protein kinase [Polyangiaceae bacterium]